jgi:hypothetical protein
LMIRRVAHLGEPGKKSVSEHDPDRVQGLGAWG